MEHFPPSEIAKLFVGRYYETRTKSPNSLFQFYAQPSVFSRPSKREEQHYVRGVDDIIEASKEANENIPCQVQLHSMDVQESIDSAILVLVHGILYSPDGGSRSFVQNFVLAKHPKGYFVQNDILRFLDEHLVEPEQQELPTSPLARDETSETFPEETIEAPEMERREDDFEGEDIAAIASQENVTHLEQLPEPEPIPEPQPAEQGIAEETDPSLSLPKSWANHLFGVKQVTPSALNSTPAPAKRKAAKAQTSHQKDRKLDLHVANLPEGISQDDLKALFARHGGIRKIYINAFRNFALISFATDDAAEAAVKSGPFTIKGNDVALSTRVKRGNMKDAHAKGKLPQRKGKGSKDRSKTTDSKAAHPVKE